jgi:hypothetical protein
MVNYQALYNRLVNYAFRSKCEKHRPPAVGLQKSVGSTCVTEFEQALTDVYDGIRDMSWEHFSSCAKRAMSIPSAKRAGTIISPGALEVEEVGYGI